MTREEIAEGLKLLEDNMVHFDELQNDKGEWIDVHELLFEAIQALSQEPCTDTVSIRKDILKCRVGKIVAYNVEWLREHWQMEMDIVCGVKPCDDAISRDALITKLVELIKTKRSTIEIKAKLIPMIQNMPSVTHKSGKWEFHCQHWSKCSICGYADKFADKWNYCPNCGAKMENVEKSLIDIKAESGDKE